MRKFGLLGYPLSHSYSAKYFAEKFTKENISDCSYQNFSLERIELFPDLIHGNIELIGLNVTIPYKEKVIEYLDELDPVAQQIGAVNTIKLYRAVDGVKLKGFNTDEYGFHNSLQPLLKLHHTKALILGTGGASKAVKYVLNKLGISFITATRKRPGEKEINYADINDQIIKEYKIIINTTPLGTYPDVNSSPALPYAAITADHILYDLVYNPETTRFLALGKAQGATILNGLQMLQLQAERAWLIWNRKE